MGTFLVMTTVLTPWWQATLPKNNAPARIAQNLGKRDGPNKWYGTLVKAVASKRRAWKVAAKYKAALIALRREAKRSISVSIPIPLLFRRYWS